jgi:hypothetical protein
MTIIINGGDSNVLGLKDWITIGLSLISLVVSIFFSIAAWKISQASYQLSKNMELQGKDVNQRLRLQCLNIIINKCLKVKEILSWAQFFSKGLSDRLKDLPKDCGVTENLRSEVLTNTECELIIHLWNELERCKIGWDNLEDSKDYTIYKPEMNALASEFFIAIRELKKENEILDPFK